MRRPLAQPRRRRFLPLIAHIMRAKGEALAALRKARAGTYARPKPKPTRTPEAP